jgi:hypothetical protein
LIGAIAILGFVTVARRALSESDAVDGSPTTRQRDVGRKIGGDVALRISGERLNSKPLAEARKEIREGE